MRPYHNFDLLQETVDIDGHLVRHADDAVEEIAQCQVENEDSDRSGHLLKPYGHNDDDGDDDDGDDDDGNICICNKKRENLINTPGKLRL